MFTSHGHQIYGTTAVPRPEGMKVMRCGGPSWCEVCAAETITAHTRILENGGHIYSPIPANEHKVHWAENGDMLADHIRLRQVAWLINGGPDDGRIVRDLNEFDRSKPHGSFTPLYMEIGD